jgi:hypothetical protein
MGRDCFGKRHGGRDGRQCYKKLNMIERMAKKEENDKTYDKNAQASFYRADIFSFGKYGMGAVLVFAEPYAYRFSQAVTENADEDLYVQQGHQVVMVIKDDGRIQYNIAHDQLGHIPQQRKWAVFRPVK